MDANDVAPMVLPAQNGAENIVEICDLYLIGDRDKRMTIGLT
jgi:hypothetical protein